MSMRQALIEIFEKEPKRQFSLEEIRTIFPKHYDISSYQQDNDLKYPQPRWHHEIRSILAKLVNDGEVDKLARDCYVYARK